MKKRKSCIVPALKMTTACYLSLHEGCKDSTVCQCHCHGFNADDVRKWAREQNEKRKS